MSTIVFVDGPHEGVEWITGDIGQKHVVHLDDGDVTYEDTGELVATVSGDARVFRLAEG